MQINPNHRCKMRSIRNDGINSVVLGSITGLHLNGMHHLENQLSSTRGGKGDLANVFRSTRVGGGHLSRSPLSLVKVFFHS